MKFVRAYTCNSKTTGRIWTLCISNNCSAIWDVYFLCAGACCDIRLASYDSKHWAQFFSGKPFVRPYTPNLKTKGYIWMVSISNDCSTIVDILCVVYNCMRDSTGELRPQIRISRSLIQNCVYILQALIYIAIWCATTHDNKTHVPYDCILHTKWWLYCQRCIVL